MRSATRVAIPCTTSLFPELILSKCRVLTTKLTQRPVQTTSLRMRQQGGQQTRQAKLRVNPLQRLRKQVNSKQPNSNSYLTKNTVMTSTRIHCQTSLALRPSSQPSTSRSGRESRRNTKAWSEMCISTSVTPTWRSQTSRTASNTAECS